MTGVNERVYSTNAGGWRGPSYNYATPRTIKRDETVLIQRLRQGAALLFCKPENPISVHVHRLSRKDKTKGTRIDLTSRVRVSSNRV